MESSCGNVLDKSYRETLPFGSQTPAVLLFRIEANYVCEANSLEHKVKKNLESFICLLFVIFSNSW